MLEARSIKVLVIGEIYSKGKSACVRCHRMRWPRLYVVSIGLSPPTFFF